MAIGGRTDDRKEGMEREGNGKRKIELMRQTSRTRGSYSGKTIDVGCGLFDCVLAVVVEEDELDGPARERLIAVPKSKL